MRPLLAIALLVLLLPGAGALVPALDPMTHGDEADGCATSDLAPTCVGVLGPHAADDVQGDYGQILLYPRVVASAAGGFFEATIRWEDGSTSAVRCTLPPATEDPAGLAMSCADSGTRASYAWPDLAWSFEGHQEGLTGSVQFLVVYDR